MMAFPPPPPPPPPPQKLLLPERDAEIETRQAPVQQWEQVAKEVNVFVVVVLGFSAEVRYTTFTEALHSPESIVRDGT